ncbi:hypothetical protein HK102_006001 [Quaeritorhiza haematococci]|nr:hypothetical protein HK102_006001 [Quaeritorhiza haematococci]
MLPAETWNGIGAWLPDYQDFANLAVALGVKWDPATQAQRMIHKYGRYDFVPHIQVADETMEDTPTKRGFLNFSTDQLRFYEYLVKRLPDVVSSTVRQQIKSTEYEHLQAFVRFGIKIQQEDLKPEPLLTVIECYPALLELLLETAQVDVDESLKVTRFHHSESFVRNCVRLLRWGVPLDLDGFLFHCLERSNKTYKYTGEDLRLRYARQGLIRELLLHGANPNLRCKIPEDPDVIDLMMLHGADPDSNGWLQQVEQLSCWSIYKLECWIRNGWVPKETRDVTQPYRSRVWFFRLFVVEENRMVAEILLDHFGQKLRPYADLSLKAARLFGWTDQDIP